MRTGFWSITALAALLAIVTCDGAAPTMAADDEMRGAADGEIRGTGVALTPKNFPRHTGPDVEEMFELGKELGRHAVFMYQWAQPDLVDVATVVVKLSRNNGLIPIVAISPTVLGGFRAEYDPPQAVRKKVGKSKLSFANEDMHSAYTETALDLAQLKPPYLCLASEINMMAFADIKEYVRFAGVYKRVYAEVKKVSPETKVFVSFQWDIYSVLDEKEPEKIAEHSKLIDIFRPELDVVAFTSYPSTHFDSPSDIPNDYYENVARHVKPSDEIMFMEMGWPTVGRGDEASQEEYVNRLPQLLGSLRPTIVAWSLLHDVTDALESDLATTGLLTTNGRKKPSFEAFRRLRDQ